MGLMLISAVIIILFLSIRYKSRICDLIKDTKIPQTNRWVVSILSYTVIACCLATIISVLVSCFVLEAFERDKLVAADTEKTDLQLVNNTSYIEVEMHNETPSIFVRPVNADKKRLTWGSVTIEFNSDTAYIETHSMAYSNKLLRWLLIWPCTYEYTIHTPESGIDNIYETLTD